MVFRESFLDKSQPDAGWSIIDDVSGPHIWVQRILVKHAVKRNNLFSDKGRPDGTVVLNANGI
jgi:hypothetical protein